MSINNNTVGTTEITPVETEVTRSEKQESRDFSRGGFKTKVYYKQGTKAQYLALPVHLTNGLYFCTDTKELFKGDDLYSDGVRFAETFAKLPPFDSAADGILYVCKDTGSGFVLDADRGKWVPVLFAPDNETIIVNEKGLLEIKKIPTETIDGLDQKVKELIKEMGGSADIDLIDGGNAAGIE